MFSYFKSKGPGLYHISLRILADKLDFANRQVRLIIRGTEENSFIRQYGSNYYGVVSNVVDLTENKWCYLSGTVNVTAADIASGYEEFFLMFDVLNAVSLQNIYIDDFKLKKVTTFDDSFDTLPNGKTLNVGQQQPLVANLNYDNLVYTSSNTSIATVDSLGVVTAKSPGKAQIEVLNLDTGQADYCYIVVNFVESTAIIPDGIYYVKNRELKNYMQLDDNGGIVIENHEFNMNTDINKWRFTYVSSGGYYEIISVSSEKALSVENVSAENHRLIQKTYDNTSSKQQWYIYSLDNGYYKFCPKSGVSVNENFCMAVGDGIVTSEGRNVEQRDYSEIDQDKGQWQIIYLSNDVKLEHQQTSTWCWVASARMLSFEYMASPVSQSSAAVYIKLNIVEEFPTSQQIIDACAYGGGTNEETLKALEYIIGADNIAYCTTWEIYSEQTLREVLDVHPIIISRGMYPDDKKRENGHGMVVYGYYYDSSLGRYCYNIYDPAPVYEGDTYSRTYDAICNGRNALRPSDIDMCYWEGVVGFIAGSSYMNFINSPAPGVSVYN